MTSKQTGFGVKCKVILGGALKDTSTKPTVRRSSRRGRARGPSLCGRALLLGGMVFMPWDSYGSCIRDTA
jgi:hypothetical protein